MKNSMFKFNKSNMLKASLLVIFTSLLPLSYAAAQSTWTPKPLYYQISGALIEVGDSVVIHRDSLYYETGEKKSTWVYDKVHTVRQVGSKHHPEAVLLMNIYSWVEVGSIEPRNKAKMEPAPDPLLSDTAAIPAPEPMMSDTVAQPVPEPMMTDTAIAPKPYKVNRFSVGIRGGFASTLANSELEDSKLPLGFDALLDLQYAHYWAADQDKCRFGLMTGLSLGYLRTTRSMVWDETLSLNNGDLIYYITADEIKERNNQLQMEVPLMFSMITPKGFFLNVGPRFILPTYTPYRQTITNHNIKVEEVSLGHVGDYAISNNPVYGVITEQQENQKGKGEHQFDLSITLGLELGYEFKLKSGNSIDLGVYANYGLYNTFSNRPLGEAIAVTPVTDNGKGTVSVESLTNAYTSKMGHTDAGIKVSYNFDWVK
jgi:hypothetical protein